MKKKIIIFLITFLFFVNISALFTIIYNILPTKKEQISEESEKHLITSALKERLSLDESQAAEIGEIRSSFENELENASIRLNEKQNELFRAIRNKNPDMSLISNLIDEISLFQAHLQKEAVKRMIKEKELLNPRQQQKYFSEFDKRFGRGRGGQGKGLMRGKGRGGRGPRWLRENNN